MPHAVNLRQTWPLYAGMTIAAAAAVVASASTLAELARTAGWSTWTPWLLPAPSTSAGASVGGAGYAPACPTAPATSGVPWPSSAPPSR